jgi:rubrerythrin
VEIRKIYEYALQREHEGKKFFEDNAGRLSHASAIEAFLTLAKEEQKHIDFIESLLHALDERQGVPESVIAELQGSTFFSDRLLSEHLDQTTLESMVPDLPVLRMAYLIERDFSEFYETSAAAVDGVERDVLSMLAQWERSHERLFKYFYDQAFNLYSKMPWGG